MRNTVDIAARQAEELLRHPLLVGTLDEMEREVVEALATTHLSDEPSSHEDSRVITPFEQAEHVRLLRTVRRFRTSLEQRIRTRTIADKVKATKQ